MTKKGTGLLLGSCAIAAIALVGWLLWPGSQGGQLPYQDAAITTQGRTLYGENCASCHGVDLKGEPDWRSPDADGFMPAPPHDQSGHTWHHPDATLIEITRVGTEAVVGGTYRSRMSGFAEILSEEEIVAVLAYIKSTWPAQVIDQHNRINAEAALGK